MIPWGRLSPLELSSPLSLYLSTEKGEERTREDVPTTYYLQGERMTAHMVYVMQTNSPYSALSKTCCFCFFILSG